MAKIFGILFIFFAVISFLSKFEFKFLQIGSAFDLLPLGLIVKMGFPDREAFNEFVQPYLSIAIGILLAIGIMFIHLSSGPKRRLGSIAPHYGMRVFLKNLLLFLSLLFSGFFVTPLILGIFRFPIALPETLSFLGEGIVPFLIGFGVAVVFLVASLLIKLRQTYDAKYMKMTYFKDKLLIVYPNRKKRRASNNDIVLVFQDIYNDGYTIVDKFEDFGKNNNTQLRIVFRTKLTKSELKEQFNRRHKAFVRKTSYGLNMPPFYSDVLTFSVGTSSNSYSQHDGDYRRYQKTYEVKKTTYFDGSTKTSSREIGKKDLGLYSSTTTHTSTLHVLMKNKEPFLQSNSLKITWNTSYSSTKEKYIGK